MKSRIISESEFIPALLHFSNAGTCFLFALTDFVESYLRFMMPCWTFVVDSDVED